MVIVFIQKINGPFIHSSHLFKTFVVIARPMMLFRNICLDKIVTAQLKCYQHYRKQLF